MKSPEPILEENKDRFVLFPIKHKEIWELYKKSTQNFWYVDKVSFIKDIKDYEETLSDSDKQFIRFAISTLQLRFNYDMSKLLMDFLHEVQYPEARCFFGFQVMMTSIHSETYSLLSGTYLGETAHLNPIFKEVLNSDAFKNKSEWIKKNFLEEKSFPKRIVAYITIQRILYSSLFAGIMSFKDRKLIYVFCMLTHIIYADEGLFTDFALTIYFQLKNKLPVNELERILSEAIDIEMDFITSFQSYYDSIGIKTEQLINFSKYNADTIMKSLSGNFMYGGQANSFKHLKWERNFIKIDINKKAEEEYSKEISFDYDF